MLVHGPAIYACDMQKWARCGFAALVVLLVAAPVVRSPGDDSVDLVVSRVAYEGVLTVNQNLDVIEDRGANSSSFKSASGHGTRAEIVT